MTICLSNASDIQDGLGAQIQRRLEVRHLADYLNIGYRPVNITTFDSNYGDGMPTFESRERVLCELPSLFPLLYDGCKCENHFNFPTLDALIRKSNWRRIKFIIKTISFIVGILRIRLLVILPLPHKIDLNWTEVFSNTIPLNKVAMQSPVHILMHLPWARSNLLPDRKMPIEWYQEILKSIVEFLESEGHDYKISLHTDAGSNLDPKERFLQISPETSQYWTSSGNKSFLENKQFAYKNMKEEFAVFKNLNVIQNVSPIEIWKDFQKSHILILSNSSLSHVGSLVSNDFLFGFIPNRNPFKHPKLIPVDLSLPN